MKTINSIFKVSFLLFVLMVAGHTAYSQTAALLPNASQTFLDNNGNPLSSGTVNFYIPGTTTPKMVWQDANQTTPWTQPITLNAAGRPPGDKGIYGNGTYRQIVKAANTNIIWDQPTAAVGTGGGSGTSVGDGNSVGTILQWSGMVAPNQYQFAYGQSLVRATYPELLQAVTLLTDIICTGGSQTVSGITDTSNIPVGAALEANCIPAGSVVTAKTLSTVTVSIAANVSNNTSGRFFPYGNGNGTTTFNAPDLRGRVAPGRNNMGGVVSSNLNSTYYGSIPDATGATGGSQSRILAQANLPNVNFNVSIPSGQGAHTHSYTLTTAANQTLQPGGANIATVSTSTTNTGSSTLPAMTGTAASGGSGTAFAIIPPSITMNYVIKVTPDTSVSGLFGVASIGGMQGIIACGTGLTCAGNVISAINSVMTTDNVLYTAPFTGAVQENQTNYNKHIVYVTDFGAICDGATDDTSAIQTGINATSTARVSLSIPSGSICIYDGLTLPNYTSIIGTGTLKRKNNAVVAGASISGVAVHDVNIGSIKVDGNRANQTTPAHNIFFSGSSYNNSIDGLTSVSAKGYGNGIGFLQNSDVVNGTLTRVSNISTSDNEGGGFYSDRGSAMRINGINSVGDLAVPVSISSTSGTANSVSDVVIRNLDIDCKGASIIGAAIGGILGTPATNVGLNITMFDTVVKNCGQYGLAYQVTNGLVSGLKVENSGQVLNYAPVLFAGNNITLNSYDIDWAATVTFQIDSGACIGCLIGTGTIAPKPGVVNSSTAINIGGSINSTIRGTRIKDNGLANVALIAVLPESIGTNGSNLTLADNTLECGSTNCIGIAVSSGFDTLNLANNVVTGTSCENSYQIDAFNVFWQGKNRGSCDSTNSVYSLASAPTLVIPETADFLFVTGTTTVNNILTTRQNYLQDKTAWVTITSGGTSCAANTTFPLTFSGGGGSGASAEAYSNAGGVIYAVKMLTLGSSYTSAPSAVLTTPGTCSGVTLTPVFRPANLMSTRTLGITGGTGFTLTHNPSALGSIASSNQTNISVTNNGTPVYLTNIGGLWGQHTTCPTLTGDAATGAGCEVSVVALGGKSVSLGGNFSTSAALAITNGTTDQLAIWNSGTTLAGFSMGTGVKTALNNTLNAANGLVGFSGALGTPTSGVATNLTGTASGLTAGNVTTNANLTGPITSVGNATSIASQTGTGTKFVVDTSPTLVTPNIGVATGTSLSLSNASSSGVTATVTGAGSSALFTGTNSTNGRAAIIGNLDGFNSGFNSTGGGNVLMQLGGTTYLSVGGSDGLRNQFTFGNVQVDSTTDTTPAVNTGAINTAGGFSAAKSAYIGAQIYLPNITTTSTAQTGTVCWATGTGKFTVDTTVGCLSSIMGAKNITKRLTPSDALDITSKLNPFAFRYKKGWGDDGRYEQFGLGAEEVAKVDERLVGRDFEGNLQGVRYQEMTAVLAGAIQQLKADNDNLKKCYSNWKCRFFGIN